ncbi:hypothetical protein PHAVU_010G034901 [Phaseolus vulgaris]
MVLGQIGALFPLGLMALVAIKWVGPFVHRKGDYSDDKLGTNRFSSLELLAVVVFATIGLFPTLVLPSSPFIWVFGMTFGYFFGFLLIISAAIGVSLPFMIGSIFHHKIEWLEKYPKKASLLRSAGGGNWFHQFRAVALLRVSILYNYCAVATCVKYWPYLIGSLVGMVPEIFV